MKKILLALLLLIATSYGYAQNNVNVSGMFTSNMQPRANELMHIYYHSLDSNTTAVLEDSVFTDSTGYYTLTKSLPLIFSQGYVRVTATDCNFSLQSKVDYFSPLKSAVVINFTCPSISIGCNNSYMYTLDTANGSTFNVYFSATNNLGPNVTYDWSFGDGTFATGLYASHMYLQPGAYAVCLTTTNTTTLCTSVYCDSIYVANFNFSCYVSFSTMQNPASLVVDFAGHTKGSLTATLYWDFGDNTTAVGNTATHTYAVSGMYNVCVTLVDSINNCVSSYCNLVQAGTVAFDPCSAEFRMFMLPDTIQPGSSTIYFSLLNNFAGAMGYWSFGDGTTGSGQSIVHSYALPGTYTVTVIVTDTSFKCTDTVTKQILIDGGIMKILGIEGSENNFELNATYPNPVSDKLNIEINSLETQTLTIQVIDLMGRVLLSSKINSSTGNNPIEVPTGELNSGMYIVEIISNKGNIATKFIKK